MGRGQGSRGLSDCQGAFLNHLCISKSFANAQPQVSKLYLYLNEPSRSVAQLNRHVNRFRELSNIWGIGEETFEFWSWLSKQCAECTAICIVG